MSTSTMKNTKITFTRDQKNFLDEFLTSQVNDYVKAIMDEDDEDTTEEYLHSLAKKVFTTKSLKIGKASSTEKKSRAKKTGPKAPSNSYILWSNAEGRERSKNQLMKKFTKELSGLDDDELEEKYDGLTDKEAILKTLVTSKLIISNAAKLWKVHKEADDETYQNFQSMYLKNREAYKAKLQESTTDEPEEAGEVIAEPTEEKSTKSKTSEGGKAKSKKSKANSVNEDAESVTSTGSGGGKAKSKNSTKTHNLGDFASYDGISAHLGMIVRGSLTTKNKKNKFESLEDAVEAMNEDDDATTIVLDNKGKFTLRSSAKMSKGTETQSPCMTWVKNDDSDAE